MASNQTQVQRNTAQWAGGFGDEYHARNPQTPAEVDKLYEVCYGIARSQLAAEFLGDLDRDLRILEIATGCALQLEILQSLGFQNLYGLEVNPQALNIGQKRTKWISLIRGDALDLPFKDNYFDLVFTSGLLIHIPPESLRQVMAEICRCSSSYIWGFEYYAENLAELDYHGQPRMMWEGDYPAIYCGHFKNLRVVKKEIVGPNLAGGLCKRPGIMFLLKKN